MATIPATGPALPATVASTPLTIMELLEHIIFQLDPADQVTAHQVCKTWNTLVNTSPRLRYSAFPWMKPVPATEFLLWVVEHDMSRRPLSDQWHLNIWQPRLSFEPGPWAMTLSEINPVLRLDTRSGYQKNKCCTDIVIDGRKILSWTSDFWRGQLLVQPPVPLSSIKFTRREFEPEDPLCPYFSNNVGDTLGDLYDTLKDYEASTGAQVGMIRCRMQSVLARAVDFDSVREAHRFKEWEDDVAEKTAKEKKKIQEEGGNGMSGGGEGS